MKSKSLIFSVFLTSLLASCTSTKLIESAYPDREKYELQNAGSFETSRYLCEISGTPEAAQENAEAAHEFFHTELNDRINIALAESLEADSSSLQFANEINDIGEQVAEELDEKFGCIYY